MTALIVAFFLGCYYNYHFGQVYTNETNIPKQRQKKTLLYIVFLLLFLFFYIWRTTSLGRAASNAVIVRLPFTLPHTPSLPLTHPSSPLPRRPFCMIVGHIAENCTSQERLCYNCRKPGHESSACPEPRSVSAKQCYSCGGIGHIQAECPTLRLQGSNQKCYVRPVLHGPSQHSVKRLQNCGHFGHIARVCPNDAVEYGGFAPRAPPPGRGLNVAALPPVKCYRCGGPNHMARYAN